MKPGYYVTKVLEKHNMLNRIVARSWYIHNYDDVKMSGIDPKFHFANYGKVESRIANPFYLIRTFYLRSIAICLYCLGIRFYEYSQDRNVRGKRFVERFLNVFINTEFPFLNEINDSRTKLYFTSWVSGGVEQAVNLFIRKDLEIYDSVIIIRSIKNICATKFPVFEVEFISQESYKNCKVICLVPFSFLEAIINSKSIESIDIHHVFGFERMIDFILENYHNSIFFYFHDYYLFSNNWSFFEIPLDINHFNDNFLNSMSNDTWSLESRELLIKRVNNIIATSLHSYMFLSSQINIPTNKLVFNYLPEESDLEFKSVKISKPDAKPMKVLILGNMGIYKGLLVLNEIVNLMNSNPNFSFYHIGSVSEGSLHPNIQSFGWLDQESRINQIKALNADVALLISQCPETYCLVLSELIRFGIPIIASKVGAITERIYDRENNFLIEDFTEPSAWVEQLLNFGHKDPLEANPIHFFDKKTEKDIFSRRKRQNL